MPRRHRDATGRPSPDGAGGEGDDRAERSEADAGRFVDGRPAETPDGGRDGSGGRGVGWLASHPFVRAGTYAWALVGLVAAAVLVGLAVGALRLVVVPLLLALFPAALLAPVVRWLRRAKVPAGLASLLTILGVVAVLAGVGTALAPQVAEEIPQLVESVTDGIGEVEAFLDERSPFGVDAAEVRHQLDQAVAEIDTEALFDFARTGALGAATAVAEILGMTLLIVVVLFFYLKDGQRIARWLRNLFPRSVREDVDAVGGRAWYTIGAYFRGQLLVAVVDAIGIGLGLLLLGVPLALPLAVLVFFGGLFPIVGAVLAGAIAVLVALASSGWVIALAVLAVVVGVQQLESNVLAPVVLGRATALHPLGVLTAITGGAILLGVLGAFLAVPVAASIVRGVGAFRERRERADADATPAARPATG